MIFAAFPHWYATLFSGFYLALLLILVALIVRGVAFEFRSKDKHPAWRATWDWMLFVGSALPAILWGVALADLLEGTPIDAKMNYTGTFFDLLSPYSLLSGLCTLALFVTHGAIFLNLKSTDPIRARALKATKTAGPVATVLLLLFAAGTYFWTDAFTRYGLNPGLVPLLALEGLVALADAFLAPGMQIVADLRVLEDTLKALAVERHQLGICDHVDVGCARLVFQERELPDKVARSVIVE